MTGLGNKVTIMPDDPRVNGEMYPFVQRFITCLHKQITTAQASVTGAAFRKTSVLHKYTFLIDKMSFNPNSNGRRPINETFTA